LPPGGSRKRPRSGSIDHRAVDIPTLPTSSGGPASLVPPWTKNSVVKPPPGPSIFDLKRGRSGGKTPTALLSNKCIPHRRSHEVVWAGRPAIASSCTQNPSFLKKRRGKTTSTLAWALGRSPIWLLGARQEAASSVMLALISGRHLRPVKTPA